MIFSETVSSSFTEKMNFKEFFSIEIILGLLHTNYLEICCTYNLDDLATAR